MSTVTSAAGRSRTLVSVAVGVLFVALATATFALVSGFRPPPGFVGDFTQDWLSAREFRDGRAVYGNLPDAYRRQTGEEPPRDFLRWNAHPPGSVLLVLPLATLDHDRAFVVWNLLTFPLFVIAIWIVAVELGIRRGVRAAALAAGLSVLGATSHPLYQQVINGQFNALLAFLIAVAWAAERRGRCVLAGTALGAAIAVKLFPGFLLVYFWTTRRWRTARVAIATGLAIHALALGLFGPEAFRTYVLEVIPAVSSEYGTKWNNLSAPAFWLRLFDPTPASRVLSVVNWPSIGRVLAAAAQVTITALVLWAGLRARTPAGRDRAYSAAVVGMLLVCPITWPHSLVMLVVPVGVLLAGVPSGLARLVLAGCLAMLWLPDNFVPWLVYGRDEALRMAVHRHHVLTAGENLLVASVPHYALVGVFVLALRFPHSGGAGSLPQLAERTPGSMSNREMVS